VKRVGTVVSFSSDDPGVVTPSPGSRNDPRRGDPGGASVELLRPDGAVHALSVPAGRGWHVAKGRTAFWGASGRYGPALWMHVREGGGLRLQLWGSDLMPSDASGGLRVRISMGSLRICADFGPGTIVESSGTRLVAKAAPKSVGYDCTY
jgi:hypothetical protein